MRQRLAVAPALVLVGAVLVGSLGTAFAQSLGAMSLTGDGQLGWDAYYAVLAEGAPTALFVGITVAAAATALAVAVGMAVVVAVRATARGGRLLASAAALTVPVPHLVGAVGVGLLLSDSGLLARLADPPPGEWPQLVAGRWWAAVVLELAWKESAFIALVVLSSLPADMGQLDDTAAVLGASARRRFTAVTLPLARPALIVAATVSFVYAVGSYEVAWLLGPIYPESLPVLAYRLFTSTDLAVRPEAMAASMLLVGVCLVATLFAAGPLRRRWVAT